MAMIFNYDQGPGLQFRAAGREDIAKAAQDDPRSLDAHPKEHRAGQASATGHKEIAKIQVKGQDDSGFLPGQLKDCLVGHTLKPEFQ
jgi:hypothetical protein